MFCGWLVFLIKEIFFNFFFFSPLVFEVDSMGLDRKHSQALGGISSQGLLFSDVQPCPTRVLALRVPAGGHWPAGDPDTHQRKPGAVGSVPRGHLSPPLFPPTLRENAGSDRAVSLGAVCVFEVLQAELVAAVLTSEQPRVFL